MSTEDEIQFGGTPEKLDGVDFTNDDLFYTHEFEDETSAFDPKGRWQPGGEYYSRTYRVRVPIAFRGCEELVYKYINMIIDDYPGLEGVWVEAATMRLLPRQMGGA